MPPAIRRLKISNFRGIKSFGWSPNDQLNVIVGPPDTLKSTILAAIALLFAPFNVGPRNEFDYFDRNVNDGFIIEALIGGLISADIASEKRLLPLFGLTADGKLIPLPEPPAEPVLHVRCAAEPDLSIEHTILSPTGDPVNFGVALRKRMGLIRIADDSASAHALRFSSVSLLGRQFDAADLRGSVQHALSSLGSAIPLSDATKTRLATIRDSFSSDGLPRDIDLGLASPQGSELLALVDLVRGANLKTAIPIRLSGSGTRSLITLSLLAQSVGTTATVIFEEPERGLKPYRQRIAAQKILTLSKQHQTFVTTHSPIVLKALAPGTVWRTNKDSSVSMLSDVALKRLMDTDPEAFFSLLPLICEGLTELGLCDELLPHFLGKPLEAFGIHLVNGGGNHAAASLAMLLHNAGMKVAAFVDNETDNKGLRADLAAKTAVFCWPDVKNIEHYVGKYVPLGDLRQLLNSSSKPEKYRLVELRDSLPALTPKTTLTWDSLVSGHSESIFREKLAEAMDDNGWFKNREDGASLGRALLDIRKFSVRLRPRGFRV